MKEQMTQKSKHKIPNSNNGITLIALVITIIVMLILVAVTISMAINGGLFDYAGKAVGDTQNKIDEEQALASGGINVDGVWYESIDEYLSDTKKDTNPGTLETIGTDKYQINSIEDLVALAYSVNSGETTYLGKTIELGENLDFQSDSSYADPQAKYVLESASVGYKPDVLGTGIKELLLGDNGFIPIGTGESSGFYGTIKGNNKTIKNMKITTITTYGGLIGVVAEEQALIISDLGMEKSDIKTTSAAGGIVACNSGPITITNCYNTGTVICTTAQPTGGILGWGSGTITITNCCTTGMVSSSGAAPAGGILGTGTATITNCYNAGSVTSETAPAGGIVGYATGNITNCYNTGTVVSGNNALIGGVAGTNSGTITNCYFMKGSASVGIGNSGTGEATEKEESAMQTDAFLAELKGTTDNTAWKRDDLKNNKMPILSWQ